MKQTLSQEVVLFLCIFLVIRMICFLLDRIKMEELLKREDVESFPLD